MSDRASDGQSPAVRDPVTNREVNLRNEVNRQLRQNAVLQTEICVLTADNARLRAQLDRRRDTHKDWVIAVLLGVLGLVFIARGWWGA